MFLKKMGANLDPTGPVYYDGTHYLRYIEPVEEHVVQEMFSSGLIKHLHDCGLIPEFDEDSANLLFPDSFVGSLVIKSPAVKPINTGEEWSFLMFKDAALAFLEIVLIADQYGFTCRDAHIGNFIFDKTRPLWVDLGSFGKKESFVVPHPWLVEFFTNYLVPLKIWKLHPSIAHSIACRPLPYREAVSLLLVSCQNDSVFAHIYGKLTAQFLKLDNYHGQGIFHKLLKAIFKKSTPKRIAKLCKEILPLQAQKRSAWKSYQDDSLVDGKIVDNLNPRFERVISLLGGIKPQSVLELAGNAGVLSEAIARRMPQTSVICTDYDSCAIDSLHIRQKNTPLPNLSYFVLDFMQPPNCGIRFSPPCERFKSECVIALAVTHHLSLTQGFTFDEIFNEIRKFSLHTVLIEFMPLGLYNGKAVPNVPGWYSEEKFRISFERFFNLEQFEQLEENRILFYGTVAKNDSKDIVMSGS